MTPPKPRADAMALTLPLDDEELSDTEIQRLLKEAEIRLRATSGSTELTDAADTKEKRKPLPKLHSGLQTKAYIQEKNGIALADPARLVAADQRKLADTLWSVEDLSKSKKTVCASELVLFDLHEEIYPNILLDADQQSVLDCPAFLRAISFIVTLTTIVFPSYSTNFYILEANVGMTERPAICWTRLVRPTKDHP